MLNGVWNFGLEVVTELGITCSATNEDSSCEELQWLIGAQKFSVSNVWISFVAHGTAERPLKTFAHWNYTVAVDSCFLDCRKMENGS